MGDRYMLTWNCFSHGFHSKRIYPTQEHTSLVSEITSDVQGSIGYLPQPVDPAFFWAFLVQHRADVEPLPAMLGHPVVGFGRAPEAGFVHVQRGRFR